MAGSLDIGQAIGDIGGAVGALFSSKGSAAQAADYQGAAELAQQNAQLSSASTRIQETQVARSVSQSLGTTIADVAGAGFTTSGSALDVLRSSAQQGSLAKSLVNIQGAINENAYAAQAGAYSGEAKAAGQASKAGTISAIASLGGALVNSAGSIASAGGAAISGIQSLFGSSDSLAAAAGVDQSAAVWVDSAGNSVAAGTAGAIQLTADQATQLAQTGVMPASIADQAISSGTDTSTSFLSDVGNSISDIGNSIGDFFSSLF